MWTSPLSAYRVSELFTVGVVAGRNWSSVASLVDLELDAVGPERPALDEPQLQPVDSVGEEPPPATEDCGEDHQPQLVDEVCREQCPDQGSAAGDEDGAVRVVLELRDRGDDVAGEDGRVLPLGVGERR